MSLSEKEASPLKQDIELRAQNDGFIQIVGTRQQIINIKVFQNDFRRDSKFNIKPLATCLSVSVATKGELVTPKVRRFIL